VAGVSDRGSFAGNRRTRTRTRRSSGECFGSRSLVGSVLRELETEEDGRLREDRVSSSGEAAELASSSASVGRSEVAASGESASGVVLGSVANGAAQIGALFHEFGGDGREAVGGGGGGGGGFLSDAMSRLVQEVIFHKEILLLAVLP